MNIKRDLSILAVLVLIIFSAAMFKVGTGILESPSQINAPMPVPDVSTQPQEDIVTLALNESGSIRNVVVTPKAVVEDSRCAEGVQCIWAGTVKVLTDIVSGLGTATETIELGNFVTTEAEKVTLIRVAPYPKAGEQISNGAYRITYRIERRPLSDTHPVGVTKKCYIGGCSGQICSGQEGMASTCEYRESYACYKTATCERQANGECGWTQTASLAICLKNAE